ncbi:hypothetical protein E1B28_005101 [Marasmius oreades]|uniref:Uncharacterized protein n=1 Tax=Marasmius oreades TaxID=181124 RepID=A0A9P8ADN4_9AGAR|nr:uncharacterized protein E1B28_005101 [Marasmius oreades]KAG7097782.1 hypothetical protein E1B28_005101 [Marasmius oreades]
MSQGDRERLLLNPIQSEKFTTISEYQLFTLTRKHPEISRKNYLSHFDFGTFTMEQKRTIVGLLGLDLSRYPFVWNSLVRSDKVDGVATFFEYLRMATQEYTRKALILKVLVRFFSSHVWACTNEVEGVV